MSLASIDVAVLCGGLGTRLGLPDRPKCLAEINGRPYLHWLFRKLRSHGARHVVLCAGHKGEQVSDFVAGEKHGLEIDVIVEPEQKGTAHALYTACQPFASKTAGILAINGDTMVDHDLTDFIFRVTTDGRPMGTLWSRIDGNIHGGFAGHYALTPGMLPHLLQYRGVQDMFAALRRSVCAVVGGSYIDIGTPETLAAAGPFFDRVFNL